MNLLGFGVALWLLSALFLLFVGTALFMSDSLLATTPLMLVGVDTVRSMLIKAHTMERATALTILAVFFWALIELALRARRVYREYMAIRTFRSVISKSNFADHIVSPFNLRDPRATRRASLVVECGTQDVAKLHDAIPSAAALDATTMVGSYTPLVVYAWILPVLGFIGTATGMADAIGGFKGALGKTRDFDTLVETLSQQVIPGLAGAFQITILALGASLVVYLCTSALRAWDQDALTSLDQLCIMMLSRIPLPVAPEVKETATVLGSISQQLEGLLKVPLTLDKAADAIGLAATALASASNDLKESASADFIIRRIKPGERQ